MDEYISQDELPTDLKYQSRALVKASDLAKKMLSDKGYSDVLHKMCMPISFMTVGLLAVSGCPVRVAAGSASWRMISLEGIGDLLLNNVSSDDIIEEFGYKFNEALSYDDILKALRKHEFPEIHAWIETPSAETGDVLIFDPCFGYQMKQMHDVMGKRHLGPKLSDCLFTDYSSAKKSGHNYVRSELATFLAYKVFAHGNGLSSILKGYGQ
jgi:hypothetical protein